MVDAYLDRLDAALDGIPDRRRRELVAEVAVRIDTARLELVAESEAGVRAVLAAIGSPEAVAAEEHAFHPWSSRRSRLRRGAAAIVALSLVAAGSATVVASTRGASPSGRGPATATVPDVVGRTESAAAEMLRSVHLAVEQVDEVSDAAVAAGIVAAVRPGSGSVLRRGSRVTIEVSDGR